MKTPLLAAVALMLFVLSAAAQQTTPSYARYVENKGQWPKPVKYMARLSGGELWVDDKGLMFNFFTPADIQKLEEARHGHAEIKDTDPFGMHAYRMKFIRNASATVKGKNAERDYINYYLGNDPSKWVSNASVSTEIEVANASNGIDYHVYTRDGFLKYDVIMHAGSNPTDLYIEYEGVEGLKLENGDLHISLSNGEVIEKAPVAYQLDANNIKTPVAVEFAVQGNKVFFELGKYNTALDVVIDPTLIFSSYSGSTADNWGYTATYDNAGNLYAGGIAFGSGYPTTAGAFLTTYSGASIHAAISKFNPTGTTLLFSTYLGGNHSDAPHSLVVDHNDNLIVMGTTSSTNFPTTAGAYDETFNAGGAVTVNSISYANGSDIYVTKFNSAGTALVASTVVGGTNADGLNTDATLSYNYADESRGEVIVNDAGEVFVSSVTRSTNFPTTAGALATTLSGAQDACAFKLDAGLTTLLWSTYIGGSNVDAAYSLKLGTNNRVYIVGGTRSTNFPSTAGGLHPAAPGGSVDGFLIALNQANGAGITATYLGTNDYDQSYLVELNEDNDVFVVGQTEGAYPISPGVYNNPNSGQFIHKLNPDLNVTDFSTVFGTGSGSGIDISLTALLVDNCQNIYVSGWGGNTNVEGSTTGLPVTPDAYDASTDGSDFYFLVLERDAQSLLYGSFFGSGSLAEHVDGGTSRFDKNGTIYQAVCAGCGGSDNFPTTPGAWSPTNNSSNCNIGVIKMEFVYDGIQAEASAFPNIIACDPPFDVDFTGSASGVDHYWNFDDGTTSLLENPTHTFSDTGHYSIMYIAIDSSKCNIADTTYLTVEILQSEEFDATLIIPPYDPCAGGSLTVDFNFTGTGADYIAWDMGDGTTYTNVPTVSHTYTAHGTYIVEMYAYDSTCGRSGTITDTVVYQSTALDVNANASPNVFTCEPPYTVTFSSGASAPVNYWDFDNGDTSMLANPTYTFTDTGSYTITYIAIDSSTCNISDTAFITVQILQPEEFSAELNIPPYDPCAGGPLTVDFNFTGTGADSIAWDMGDGTVYTNIFNLTHTYTTPGVYIVEMYAYDSVCGRSGTVTDTIDYNNNILNVSANASPNVFTCDPPYTVNFSNGGTSAPNHFWDFDNGDVSLLGNPTYTFTDTGTFNIMYIAIDSATCNIADTSYITVEIHQPETFDALLDVPPYDPCAGGPLTVDFNFTGTGADYISWSMGDGTNYTNVFNLSHTYTTQGTYIVTMYAYDSVCGRSGTVTDTIVFNPTFVSVSADASPDVFACDPPYEITFSNNGGVAPIHFWNFDDGVGTSNAANPTYTFTTPGVYNVMYVATDPLSCNISDTAYAVVTILQSEEFDASFSFVPPPPCTAGDTLLIHVAFTGTGADSLVWNMGDGTVFTNNTVVDYIYTIPGTYTIVLTAYDFVCGKVESISSTFVKDEPTIGGDVIIPNVFSPNGDGINDEFYMGYAGIAQEISQGDMDVYEFKVFNRWGTLVFDNEGTKGSWDGKINGTVGSEGVYYIIARYQRKCGDADVIEKTGYVHLVK